MTRKAVSVCIFILAFAMCKERHDDKMAQRLRASAATPPRVATTVRKTDVSIKFSGLVVHIFAANNNRSAVLRHAEHMSYLNFPASLDTDQLKAATGCEANAACDVTKPVAGRIRVGPISGFSVRVVGVDANNNVLSTIQPGLDYKTGSFNDYVPHLLKVSDNTMTKLKQTLFEPTPDGNSWALFVPLEGGSLKAQESCKKSKFVADYALDGTRSFAEYVTLTGYVEETAAIQFLKRGYSEWKDATTVQFKTPPTGTTMQVIADPRSKIKVSHFHLFRGLGDPLPSKFDDIVYVDCESTNLDPSCTNSQWP